MKLPIDIFGRVGKGLRREPARQFDPREHRKPSGPCYPCWFTSSGMDKGLGASFSTILIRARREGLYQSRLAGSIAREVALWVIRCAVLPRPFRRTGKSGETPDTRRAWMLQTMVPNLFPDTDQDDAKRGRERQLRKQGDPKTTLTCDVTRKEGSPLQSRKQVKKTVVQQYTLNCL